ncbi:uncharacterized protein LOC142817865 [Rhipicephalus microplus]|uniref:uncharacterized protein LOC142817865 n=1 Tax=Rhipicephalus microplus TaxID=6941 RepID=UPI003F6C4572
MRPMACAVYSLLVFLVSTSAERSFDYDVDDLEQVESFIWDSSDAPHMGPTRPGPPNPAPTENLIGHDPNLHQQISEIVRQIIAEYSHRNQLPAGIWVGGKHLGPGLQQMPFAPPNPCFPPIGLQIPVIPWKMDNISPRDAAINNNNNNNNNNMNSNSNSNNNNHNNNNANSVASNNNDKPQPGSLPPLPPYQKPAWRPAVPVFPIPHQPQQSHDNQAHLKSPQTQPAVKTSFSISTSHPVPLPKRDLQTPLLPWRSAAPAPAPVDQQSTGAQTMPPPIRPPKLSSHLRFAQPPRPSIRGHASRRGQHLLPQKIGVSSLPKNLPADDVYYASQSSKLPRKVVKQGVFQPKRKPQVSQSITVVEQGKNGEWFKVPVDKVTTGLGRRNYEVVELHKADDVRKVGPSLNNGEESIHYIHIQES